MGDHEITSKVHPTNNGHITGSLIRAHYFRSIKVSAIAASIP